MVVKNYKCTDWAGVFKEFAVLGSSGLVDGVGAKFCW